ncbi:MAG: SRPBCC family protein [Actinomycetota bacterium]
MSDAPKVVPHEVEVSLHLEAPPEAVFPYLIEPERYVRWQGIKAELDPRPGGVYRVWMDTSGTIARGEFVEVEPPRRLVFTWGWEGNDTLPPGASTVELTLQADGSGTLLHLRHSGLPDGESAAMHEEGWHFFTGRLTQLVAGRDPGPMPPPAG